MNDQDSILRAIQDTFGAGMVTLIGSGLSAASGLPSMADLATHLLNHVDLAQVAQEKAAVTAWKQIKARLEDGQSLELALGREILPVALRVEISEQIVACIDPKERKAIQTLLATADPPPLARLLQLLMIKNPQAEVITTNYDRLIEISAITIRVRVDTQFYGHIIGRHNEKLSQEELLRPSGTPVGKKRFTTVFRPHVRLSKPHGSLDWYDTGIGLIRSELPNEGERLVVVPGADKYRDGYNTPFQEHLARANKAITNATSFLMVGYGFNDDHLQTQLQKRFTAVPSVLISRTLTDKAHKYLRTNTQSIGLECDPAGGAIAHRGSDKIPFSDPIWDLDIFLKKVFEK